MSIDSYIKEAKIRVIERSHTIPKINHCKLFDGKFESICNVIIEWLNEPIVFDAFGSDHDERRRWKVSLREKFGQHGLDYVRKIGINKLRANSIFTLVLNIYLLKDSEVGELISDEVAASDGLIKNFDYKDAVNREQQIALLEEQVVKILQKLADKSNESVYQTP